MLVHHQIFYPGTTLPPPTGLYNYVLAANGVFVHARRAELTALVPLTSCAIRGLAPLTPAFHLGVPRVPAALLEELLDRARAARSAGGVPLEILFHLAWTGGWTLTLPPQWGTPTRVHALPAPMDGAAPLVEVHSHHGLPAFWSATDDADEVGLALYAVLGQIFDQPQLCVRLGIYGQWWPLPASCVFEIPSTIQDTYAGEWPPLPPGDGDAQTPGS
jgi:PRTRC genetic system protein A